MSLIWIPPHPPLPKKGEERVTEVRPERFWVEDIKLLNGCWIILSDNVIQWWSEAEHERLGENNTGVEGQQESKRQIL